MTDEDKRDLNNRIAFYEWKDLQQACEEVEEQLDAALGAYWPHLIIPKPRLALSSYSTARSFRLREVHLSLDILGKST
jgi:hypothetical protein